jgi:hypothetical protein
MMQPQSSFVLLNRLTASACLLACAFSLVNQMMPSMALAAGRKLANKAPVQRPFLPPGSQMNDFLPESGIITPASKGSPSASSATIQRANINTHDETVVGLTSIDRPHTVQLHRKVDRLDSNLKPVAPPPTAVEALKTAQAQVEQQDLNYLWNATVERNKVMRFSLEKLALPEDLQSGHSSLFLRKTLSVLISGAAIGASMLTTGGGAYQNMGVMTASNAVNNLVLGKQQPLSDLTPTEHIQLADLVDQLKVQLVDNYNQLNQGLHLLEPAAQRTQKANEAYSQALANKNQPVEQLTQAVSYYQALMAETRLQQRTSLAQIQLARIAGQEAVHEVQLAALPGSPDMPTQATLPTPGALEQPTVKPAPSAIAVKPTATPSVVTHKATTRPITKVATRPSVPSPNNPVMVALAVPSVTSRSPVINVVPAPVNSLALVVSPPSEVTATRPVVAPKREAGSTLDPFSNVVVLPYAP